MTEVWTMGELLMEVMRPGPGQPLGEAGTFRGPFPSGAPGIFIDAVARLGRSAGIVGAVGDDPFGHALVARLAADGVRTDQVAIVADAPTGVAFVAYDAAGGRRFLFHWSESAAVRAPSPPPTLTAGTRAFHVMGCSLLADEAFRTRLEATVEAFADAGALIGFDPNIRVELLSGRRFADVAARVLARTSVLLPGPAELRALAGVDDLDSAAAALFDRHPLRCIALKLGAAGCRVYTPDGATEVPAFPVDEVDPTGAGDCFDAGFLVGLLDGLAPACAADLAVAAGALAASAFGPMEGDLSRARALAASRATDA